MKERKIPEEIKAILEEVKKLMANIYGNKLKGIILYGSYARHDFTEGSDIDIIILLEDMQNIFEEREKYFDAVWEIGLKYDVTISVPPIKDEEYKKTGLPVILNAKQEGIPL